MADQSTTLNPGTADAGAGTSSGGGLTGSRRLAVVGLVALLLVGGAVAWFVLTRGHESTDDAQVDADMTTIAPRIGGTLVKVPVRDNQPADEGLVLAQIDPRDYEFAVSRAQADLAEAEAAVQAAESGVPFTSTTSAGAVSTAKAAVEHARRAIESAEREVDAARARLVTAQARQREATANATRSARDVERLRGLLAKDEVSQQQFDAATATAEAQKAAVESAASQIAEAEVGIRVAESRVAQARAGEDQARAALASAQTGPEQVAGTRARVASAQARVEASKAVLAQAQLNLERTTITSPARGTVAKKSVTEGQVIQPNQPLMAIVHASAPWVTANFKETQLNEMRAGQRATVDVDAFGGRRFNGHVESIAAATGARFSLLPPENATGNYVKVVQRVPVKIVLDEGQDPEHLLRAGMSVDATVYTK